MFVDESVPHAPLPESRFISPDARCPHPERWHSTDGDSTEIEVSELIAALVRGLQARTVIETGAAFGQTTRLILDALDANGHGILLAYENDPVRLRALVGRFAHHPRLVLGGNSLSRSHYFAQPLDFAFFDTNYETRVPEFHHFRSSMRAGTIVAFHDTGPGRGEHRMETSLRTAIEGLEGLKLIDLPTPRGLTLGQVT